MYIDKKKREYFLKEYENELCEYFKITPQDLMNGLMCTMFNGSVKIITIDGSKFNFKNSFYVKKNDIYAVFTEHYDYHEFETEELKSINFKLEIK